MTKIRKQVELNGNVYVLYNLFQVLYEKYRSTDLPKHLKDKLYDIYKVFEKEYTKDYGNADLDIIDCVLFEKLVLDTEMKDKQLLDKKKKGRKNER